MNYPFLEIAPSSKTRRFWSQGHGHNLSFFTPEFLFTRTPACKTVTAHTTVVPYNLQASNIFLLE